MKYLLSVLSLVTIYTLPAFAETGPEDVQFSAAMAIYDSAAAQEGAAKLQSYRAVDTVLNLIVEAYPNSELAVRIVLEDNVNGMDISALRTTLRDTAQVTAEVPLEDNPAAGTDSAATVASPSPSDTDIEQLGPNVMVTSADTMKAIGLNRQQRRDLQARLLVSGFDPNGIDGAIGPGSRSAIAKWQESLNLPATGYLDTFQYENLKASSQAALDQWLTNEANRIKHTPPPPPPAIALGPSNLSGAWRYMSNCGRNSRIGEMRVTGTLTLQHTGGNNYTGRMTNSQGLNGNVTARVRNRTIEGTVNFGIFIGRINVRATIENQRLVARGQDSNGCGFYASK